MEFWSIFLLHFCSRRMRHHWREESVWMGSVLGTHVYIVQVEGWGLELPRSWGDLCILGWVHTTHWPALPTCTPTPTCTIHSASWPSDLSISCPSANLQLPSDLRRLSSVINDNWPESWYQFWSEWGHSEETLWNRWTGLIWNRIGQKPSAPDRSISRVMTSSDFLHFRSIQSEVKRLRVISDHWSLQVAYFISGLKTSRSRWDSAWSEIGLTIQAGWDPESINFRIKISNKSHRVIQPLRRNPYATMQSFQHLKEINFQFKANFCCQFSSKMVFFARYFKLMAIMLPPLVLLQYSSVGEFYILNWIMKILYLSHF